MRALLADLVEPLTLLVYGAIVSVLTVAGVGVELLGISGLLAGGGPETQALWYVYVGAVVLAAAVAIARRRLFPLLSRRAVAGYDWE